MNSIIYDKEENTILIKRMFFQKKVKLSEVEKVGSYYLPFLNYIKVHGKNYLFISRAIDLFGSNFNFDLEGDLNYIRKLIEKNR